MSRVTPGSATGSITLSTSDVAIGAVEIKDATSSVRANVLDLTSSDALVVAIVDGSGNQITSFGGATQYAEDAAHSSGDAGFMMLGVRKDSSSALATTDGDYIPFTTDSDGKLWTRAAASQDGAWTVALGSTERGYIDGLEGLLTTIDADTGSILTAVELIDDTVATLGTTTYTEATTKGLTIGAVRRDADTTLVNTTNEIGPLQMNALGQLKVEVFSGETLPVSLTSTTITGTVTVDTELPVAAALGDSDANPTTPLVGAALMGWSGGTWNRAFNYAPGDAASNDRGLLVNGRLMGWNGSGWDRLKSDTTNGLDVDVTRVSGTVTIAGAVTNAGTFAVQVDGSALTALQLIDDVVYTDDTSTHSTGSSKGVGIMAAAAPTDTAVNANDIGMVGMTVNRALYASIQDALPAGTNGIGKLTANSGVTIGAVEIAAAQTLATVTTVSTLTGGGIAHDSADSGNPIKIGGKAVDIGANGTDVTAGDRTDSKYLRSGQQLVIGGHQNIVTKHIQVTDADGAQTDTALVTVSAGTAIIVTRFSVNVDAATTATGGVAVKMGFGTANTPSADANTGMLMAASGLPAGGGLAEGDGSGILAMGASNEDLRLTSEDPTGGNIDIVVSYFTILIG